MQVPNETLLSSIAAVQNDGETLLNIPDALKSPTLCMAAVQQCGCVLRHIPEKLKTPSMCLTAVQQDGYALQYVPKSLRTYDLCLAAIEQDVSAITLVPDKMKTCEMCTTAVQEYGLAIGSVPDEVITEEMVRIAIRQNGYALMSVPHRFKTHEICFEAVKRDGRALQFVPGIFRSPEICAAAIHQNADAAKYAPQENTEEAFSKILEKKQALGDGFDIHFPCCDRSEKHLLDAGIEQLGSAFFIPVEQWREILAQVQQKVWYQQYLDEIRHNTRTLESIPEDLRDFEICFAAIKSDPHNFKWVPESVLTPEFYKALAQLDSSLCELLP
jgi:hypothetical protein